MASDCSDSALLTPGSDVEVHGVSSMPHLNGKIGKLVKFDTTKGRWHVALPPHGEVVALKPSNIMYEPRDEQTVDIFPPGGLLPVESTDLAAPEALRPGVCVTVHNIPSSPELNGSMGICKKYDEARCRWQVVLRNGQSWSLKSKHLLPKNVPKNVAAELATKLEERTLRVETQTGPPTSLKCPAQKPGLVLSSLKRTFRNVGPSSRGKDPGKPTSQGAKQRQITGSPKRLRRSAAEIGTPHKAEKNNVEMSEDLTEISHNLRMPSMLWTKLYDYQKTGVLWLWSLHQKEAGGILADEMGLGKTAQTIGYLSALHSSHILQKMRVRTGNSGDAIGGGVVVGCPCTIVGQWISEFGKWNPKLEVQSLQKETKKEREDAIRSASSKCGVLVASYEMITACRREILAVPWVVAIMDEGNRLNNPNTDVTLTVKQFQTPHRIILSGSPIMNGTADLWSQVDFVRPGCLGTLPIFRREVCRPIELGSFASATRVEIEQAHQCCLALQGLTKDCVLRRTKVEVIDVIKLPPKSDEVLFCQMTPEQYQVYVEFLQLNWVRASLTGHEQESIRGSRVKIIGTLLDLCNDPGTFVNAQQSQGSVCTSGKMKAFASIIKAWHQEQRRVLVFAQKSRTLEVIARWMDQNHLTYERIDSGTEMKSRMRTVNDFNNSSKTFALLLTKRIGGGGLNIIGADRVLIFDADFNGQDGDRGRDRAWRLGQDKDVLTCRLVLVGTVDEILYKRAAVKAVVAHQALSECPEQLGTFSKTELQRLFDLPMPPPDFDPVRLVELRQRCREAFTTFKETIEQTTGGGHAEAFQPASAKKPTNACNAMLTQRQDSTVLVSRKKYPERFIRNERDQALVNQYSQKVVETIRASARECASHHRSTPTWTGKLGFAGRPAEHNNDSTDRPESTSKEMASNAAKIDPAVLYALETFLRTRDKNKAVPGKAEKAMAELIFSVFYNPRIAGSKSTLTTGQVLQHLGSKVSAAQKALFKDVLRRICDLSQSSRKGEPATWSLRPLYNSFKS